MAIIGNKADMHQFEDVSEKEAKAFANECKAIFLKISAKESDGIDDFFITIGKNF